MEEARLADTVKTQKREEKEMRGESSARVETWKTEASVSYRETLFAVTVMKASRRRVAKTARFVSHQETETGSSE